MSNKILSRFFFYFVIVPVYFMVLLIIASRVMGTENKISYIPEKKLLTINTHAKFEEVYFETADGEKINGWYIKAKSTHTPTILFAHGNGGNISYHQRLMNDLYEHGYGLLMFDYRGYGKSTGKPSEYGLYKDIDAAAAFLTARKIYPDNTILWGLSLGGAVVAERATKGQYRGLILQSTFTSAQDMAKYIYLEEHHNNNSKVAEVIVEILPLTQKFDTLSKMSKIPLPILIAHSKDDNVIPVNMAYRIHAAKPNSILYIVNKEGHNGTKWLMPEAYRFIENSTKSPQH